MRRHESRSAALSRFVPLLALIALGFRRSPDPRAAEPPVADRNRARGRSRRSSRAIRRARSFGPLTFRGGLSLTSSYPQFGGISSIRVDADGARFLAVTDKGRWLRGRIVYDGTRPAGIADAEMAPMLGPDGRPLAARGWYDTEAMARGRRHRLARHRARAPHRAASMSGATGCWRAAQPIPVPPGIARLPNNKGIECLEFVPTGCRSPAP